MTSPGPDTDELLQLTSSGDRAARGAPAAAPRRALKRMVSLRMDPRLAARLDPSDVVQEVLAEADRRLDAYVRERPLPFIPGCARSPAIAWPMPIAGTCGPHAAASLGRRQPPPPYPRARRWSWPTACWPAAPDPARRHGGARRRSGCGRRAPRLSERDREVLALRHLEQLSAREAAAVLGLTEAALKSRVLRAMQRLRASLRRPAAGERLKEWGQAAGRLGASPHSFRRSEEER